MGDKSTDLGFSVQLVAAVGFKRMPQDDLDQRPPSREESGAGPIRNRKRIRPYPADSMAAGKPEDVAENIAMLWKAIDDRAKDDEADKELRALMAIQSQTMEIAQAQLDEKIKVHERKMEIEGRLAIERMKANHAVAKGEKDADPFNTERGGTFLIEDPISQILDTIRTPKEDTLGQQYIQAMYEKESRTAAELLTMHKTTATEKIRLQKFIENTPKFHGEAKKAHAWCANLQLYFERMEIQTVPAEIVKNAIWNALSDACRSRTQHLVPNSYAWKSYCTDVYFEKVLYSFITQQSAEGAKALFEKRTQGIKEDVISYYDEKLSLYLQGFSAKIRDILQFKRHVIDGIYNDELRAKVQEALFDVPTDEEQIRSTIITKLQFLRAFIQKKGGSLMGLKDIFIKPETINYERSGQLPMEVNSIQADSYIQTAEGEDDVGEGEGEINAVTNAIECFFCKRTGHRRAECRAYRKWKTQNPSKVPNRTGDNGRTTGRTTFSCYNCDKEGHMARDCRAPRKNRTKPEGQVNHLGQAAMESRMDQLQRMMEEMLSNSKAAGFQERV